MKYDLMNVPGNRGILERPNSRMEYIQYIQYIQLLITSHTRRPFSLRLPSNAPSHAAHPQCIVGKLAKGVSIPEFIP